MSDKGKPEQTAAEAEPKKKKGKLPIIIGFVVLMLLSGLIVGKVMMGGHGDKGKKDKKVEEEIGAKVGLDEFLVNLTGGDGHYLKITLSVGVAKGLTEEKLKEETAPIRDAIISVLCAKKLEDLATEHGKEKLKEELRAHINKELGGEKVLKVYYTEFATQ